MILCYERSYCIHITLEEEFDKFDFFLRPAPFSSHILQAFQGNSIIITFAFSSGDIEQEMWKFISPGPGQCGHKGYGLQAVLCQLRGPDPEGQKHPCDFNNFICVWLWYVDHSKKPLAYIYRKFSIYQLQSDTPGEPTPNI